MRGCVAFRVLQVTGCDLLFSECLLFLFVLIYSEAMKWYVFLFVFVVSVILFFLFALTQSEVMKLYEFGFIFSFAISFISVIVLRGIK